MRPAIPAKNKEDKRRSQKVADRGKEAYAAGKEFAAQTIHQQHCSQTKER
jgi:hypothetical protein